MAGRGILKGVNYLAKKSVGFAKKHPVAALGSVGVGIGAADSAIPAHQTNDRIMREYMGAPGAKYSSCNLMEKFAERKMVLSAKISFEKIAVEDDYYGDSSGMTPFGGGGGQSTFQSGMHQAAGRGVITEGISALRRLIGSTAQAIKEKFVADPAREKIMGQVVKKDPVVSTAERENPGQAGQAYGTMRRFAPTLSTDPNAVKSFLRLQAAGGGAMDYNIIKGLADAETSVQRAQNEGAWLRGGL